MNASRFFDLVQGLVQGEGNTVHMHYYANGLRTTVPYLAPRLPDYGLVGRDTQLDEIKKYADQNKIISILGLPGMGKTALAAAFAYENRESYPDGVLWVGLGPKADEQFVLAELGSWATALGISVDNLKTIELRARAVNSAIALRRMLLVIDDAWDEIIALAFRVGGPHCTVLLTTRFPKIADSFGYDSVIKLKELSPDHGVELLMRLAGDTVRDDREIAQQLVEKVGGCPLALVLMGRALRSEAHRAQPRRIQALFKKLNDVKGRLSLSEHRDPIDCPPYLPHGTPVSLQAAIQASIEFLDETAKRVLKTLSFLPPKPNSFSEEAALQVAHASPETIDHLWDTGLLESRGDKRYWLHQTIADFARYSLDNVSIDEASVYRDLVQFFTSFCQKNSERTPAHLNAIELEYKNILLSLDEALNNKLYSEFLTCLLSFVHFLETRGLYQVADQQFQRAIEVSIAINDATKLLDVYTTLGRVNERLGNYKVYGN